MLRMLRMVRGLDLPSLIYGKIDPEKDGESM
jgi:hypothetical protein